MKTYFIQIGNMNGQHNYKVKANSRKGAMSIAIKKHKELGRSLEGQKVYVVLSY